MHLFRHRIPAHLPNGRGGSRGERVAFEVRLERRWEIAEATLAFAFSKPEGFDFRAGQHIRMTLIDPPETDSEGDSRFLSLASSPGEEELVVALRMRDTAFKRVLKRMPLGGRVLAEMLVEAPGGTFGEREHGSRPEVFLAGGIGVVPALSILKHATEQGAAGPFTLFFANRRLEDAPFLDELQDLSRRNPSLTLIATMTRQGDSKRPWTGETGHIDGSMIERYVDDRKSPIYSVMGLPAMVGAMRSVLGEAGVDLANVRFEEFGGFSPGERHLPRARRHG